MAKSKIAKANEKIAEKVVGGYQKIEDTVVDGYKKVAQAFVGGYQKVEDGFVDKFLTKDGESAADAKARITSEPQDTNEGEKNQ